MKTSLTQELPNLNFGIYSKPLNCTIHPTIVPNILDHFLRRPQNQNLVVGSLLGAVDGTQVDIQSSFSVPMNFEQDKETGKPNLAISKDYQQKMLKFHRKVNPKEGLLGLYITSKDLDQVGVYLFKYYQDLFNQNKSMQLLPSPLIMLVDPSLEGNKLSIKVLSLVTSYLTPVFGECQYSFALKNYERSGLDVLFYGQDFVDTMAILQSREDLNQDKIGEKMSQSSLFGHKDLLKKNFGELIANMKDCEEYIEDVLKGRQENRSDLGRLLDKCMSQFSKDDMELLENQVASNFEDAVMVSSLSKLQKHQLKMSENLNQIFAESASKTISSRTKKEANK